MRYTDIMFESKWKSAYVQHTTDSASELYDEIAIRVAEMAELGFCDGDDRITVFGEIADEYGVTLHEVAEIYHNQQWSE